MHLAYAILLIWVKPPITITMLSNTLRGHSIKYEAIDFAKQGKQIKLAAIASEDQKFPDHFGIDMDAVKGAYKSNKKVKKIRGGSTISQQTAKNIFLWQGRNWIRKGLEAYSTFVIEILWGKEKILKHYLNVAEMGAGIYGVQAAAKHYFNTTPDRLSANQAAMIIASLPNPKAMNPNKQTKKLLRRQSWILKQMRNLEGDKDVKELLAD